VLSGPPAGRRLAHFRSCTSARPGAPRNPDIIAESRLDLESDAGHPHFTQEVASNESQSHARRSIHVRGVVWQADALAAVAEGEDEQPGAAVLAGEGCRTNRAVAVSFLVVSPPG
jgi:hypothetical protein